MAKISVVINTLNEAKNLPQALSSIKSFADEIVVCDMHSEDKTVEVAKKFGAKVFRYKRMDFVEPARNYALRCAQGKHILVLDADEELPSSLIKTLKKIAQENKVDYVLIPRKNIIFGKWIKNSRWWPDLIIRFFKKGKVTWSDKIHSVPEAKGRKLELPPKEEYAIVHYNYSSVDQYLERMIRYSQIQAEQLSKDGYEFSWKDLIKKPLSEFLSRFFAGEGYKDGVHGLVLALLQSFSEFVVYVKVWERQGFRQEDVRGVFEEIESAIKEIKYWTLKKARNPLRRILQGLR